MTRGARSSPTKQSEAQDVAPDYDSEIYLEGEETAEEEPEDDLTDMHESLIEIEDAPEDVEPPDEDLDEFELRLRRLRERRQNR